MNLNVELDWVVAVYLLSIRIGALFVMTPLLPGMSGMVKVRVLLTLALSALLVTGLGAPAAGAASSIGRLLVASMAELLVGATLAFGVFAAFGAASVAGKIIDVQSGF